MRRSKITESAPERPDSDVEITSMTVSPLFRAEGKRPARWHLRVGCFFVRDAGGRTLTTFAKGDGHGLAVTSRLTCRFGATKLLSRYWVAVTESQKSHAEAPRIAHPSTS